MREEDVESERVEIKSARSSNLLQRIGMYAALMLVAFLVGFVPMWLKARESGRNLAATERTLSVARLQNALASAALDARRGEHEPARQAASQFYTSLQAEIGKGDDSSLTPAQREAAQGLFAGRDEIITLLARGDPAAADRLADVYASYRKIVSG
ncbi:MAG TPA: hypothetical protein VEZ40_14860 [Pyrinomonadaceae bacterium]|nr:hypothetical protein [Pyrinomonadaceae bacterium]